MTLCQIKNMLFKCCTYKRAYKCVCFILSASMRTVVVVVLRWSKKTIMLWRSHRWTLGGSAVPVWPRRVEHSKDTGAPLLLLTVSVLWHCSRAAVRRWHLSSSSLVAALLDKLRQLDRSIAARFELDLFDVTPFQVLFQGVLESLARAPLASFDRHQLSIKQLAWHAASFYPNDMSCPTKLRLGEHCFGARCLGSIHELKVSDLVLPADAKNGTEGTHMELLLTASKTLVRSIKTTYRFMFCSMHIS